MPDHAESTSHNPTLLLGCSTPNAMRFMAKSPIQTGFANLAFSTDCPCLRSRCSYVAFFSFGQIKRFCIPTPARSFLVPLVVVHLFMLGRTILRTTLEYMDKTVRRPE